MRNMRPLLEKLLVFLIALQLGLAPLLGAAFSIPGSLDRQEDAYQMMAVPESNVTVAANYLAIEPCGMSKVGDCCFTYSCSSGQCATCSPTLIQTTQHPSRPAATPGMSLAYEGIVGLPPTSIFRPPKI